MASSSSPRDSSTTASGCSLRSTSRSRSWRRRSTCSKTVSTWLSRGRPPEVRMVRATTLLPEVKSHYGDLKNYVGGDWRTPETTEWLEDTNPATGQVIARVPLSTKDDVDRAVQEALRAWDAWRETPPLDRARHFFVLRDLMEQHSEDLARIVVQDMGKTIDEARGEIRRAIENVEVAAGIPSLMMGYNLEDGAGPGIDEEVLYQPLGVFAGISPFNFPVMVQFWFWPYAVATGNCWIAKPSEQDPTAMQLVMDLVHGAKETVTAMLDHPQIAGVSFVGSSAVAKLIYAKAAASGKRVQAGGGAKNVLVVMPDAKLDKVVSNLVSSCYGCAGERCLAGSVVVGVGKVHADLRRKFSNAAQALKVGYGLDETVQMGPVISAVHRDRVLGFIDRGEQEGAQVALDGRSVRVSGYDGYFVGPTILDDVRLDMTVA